MVRYDVAAFEWFVPVAMAMFVVWAAGEVMCRPPQTSKAPTLSEAYLRAVVANMDPTADPCEDFFGYACGCWARNYNGSNYVDMPGYMDHMVDDQLVELLRQHATQGTVYEKMWSYYESCEKLKLLAVNDFLKLVQPEVNLTWPIFRENWNETWPGEADFDWLATIAALRRYGLNGELLMLNIYPRLRNGSHFLPGISRHQSSHQLQEKDVHEIFVNFGMTEEESSDVTERVMALERRLQNLTNGTFGVEQPTTEGSIEEETTMNEFHTEESNTEESNTEESKTEESNTEETTKERTEETTTEESRTEQPTEKEAIQKSIVKKKETKNKKPTGKDSSKLESIKSSSFSNELGKNETNEEPTTEQIDREHEESTQGERNYPELTIAELSEHVNYLDWEKYFSTILEREVNATADLVMVHHLDEEYFEELRTILAESSNETIAYYIMLKFMYGLSGHLPFHKSRCVNHLRAIMPLAMNHLYEESVYGPVRKQSEAAIRGMYERLRRYFRELVEENHLGLNATERGFIVQELDTMRLKIGNVPASLTSSFVDNYYGQLAMNASDFYGNHLQLMRHHHGRHLEKLQNRVVPDEEYFYHHDAEVATSSSPVKLIDNSILVPYGYLQLPLFHHEVDPLLQYSLLGFILAHEIVHAFDMFHIAYDKDGNFNELGVHLSHHFAPHLGCLKPDENLSENIADIAGLRLVYGAYFADLENSLDSDGAWHAAITNLTNPQLFFVNSVQFLCANMEKISRLDLVTFDLEHDMHDVRVRQNWALFEEFASSFHCKEGAKMNPKDRCRLW